MFRQFNLNLLAGTLLSIVFATSPIATAQCCSGGGSAGWDGISGAFESVGYIVVEPEAIYLTVNVPETALVFVNGDPTAMGGTTRYFVIRHLEAGKKYKFEVAAQTKNAAKIDLEESTSFTLTAGERKTVTLAPYKRKPTEEKLPTPPSNNPSGQKA